MTQKIDTTQMLAQAAEAEAAGFTKVATELKTKASRLTRMVLAYELFKVVKPEHVEKFNATLKEKTSRPATEADARKLANPTSAYRATVISDQLVFTNMAEYAGLPPSDVLQKVKEAQGRKIFDRMEVAHVEPVATEVKLPDPIVFGRIDGCPDRFVIAEWGTDVNVIDLVGKHGG